LLGKRNTDRFALQTAVATIGIRGTIFIAEYVPQEPSGTASSRAHSVAALFPDRFDQMKPEGSELPGPLLLALQGGPTRSDALPDFRPQPIEPAMQVAQNVPPSTAGRSPGLYVQVLDGAIHLTNGGGTQNFTAGQFGFTPSFQQPPVILPTNPGMQFTPPPSFSSTTGSAGGTGAAKPGDVDCQVR
jgi:hypothetical protein